MWEPQLYFNITQVTKLVSLPLVKLLRRRVFQQIALLQDIVVLALAEERTVLHGGLAVWRVYGGKRFSYDVDLYHEDPEAIAARLAEVEEVEVRKARLTEAGVLYARVVREKAVVEVEVAPLRRVKSVDGRYWMVDGTAVTVLTLTPEDLLREKIDAYLSRRQARDLYDIYYLLGVARVEGLRKRLQKLLQALDQPPPDMRVLKELVLVGLPPRFETIRREVRRCATS